LIIFIIHEFSNMQCKYFNTSVFQLGQDKANSKRNTFNYHQLEQK